MGPQSILNLLFWKREEKELLLEHILRIPHPVIETPGKQDSYLKNTE